MHPARPRIRKRRMAKQHTPNCSTDGCTARAVGYIPGGETDDLLCGEHYDEQILAGLFGCLLGEVLCPDCKGRAGYILSKTCERCDSSGVVKAFSVAELRQPTDLHPCNKCKGTGLRRVSKGRPAVNRQQLPQAA